MSNVVRFPTKIRAPAGVPLPSSVPAEYASAGEWLRSEARALDALTGQFVEVTPEVVERVHQVAEYVEALESTRPAGPQAA